ncbi:hypothetical protein Q664_13065 [Archangium violaceum Cb vi76]|uniref:Immunity MXAN-0049 protein domain-containing protein n=1 Tax=Archangium violaceum Cb vi76 TaxID=1406225 RepID=A0A084SWF0_9BACT|nr:hypothetical protein Q664_13065 [Archangium violaceum Cb vi76]
MKGDHSSAVIDALPEGGPRLYLLTRGESLGERFPVGAKLQFSEDFAQLRKLYDFVTNTLRTLFVSEKVKQVLEHLGANNCEFIPVTILNHKGKVASSSHYLLNILGSEDAIDMEKSVCVMDAMKPDQIFGIRQLVLKREGLSPEALIFRAKSKMNEYFISQKLHEAFQREGITGYRVFPADGWDGVNI